MAEPSIKENRHRRSYSKRFKAEIVARCLDGTDSIASLAVAHGMNPNVLHNWVTQHRRYGMHDLGDCEEDADDADIIAPKRWVAVPSNAMRNGGAGTVGEPQATKASKNDSERMALMLTGRSGVTAKLEWHGDGHASLADFMKALLT